MNTDELTKWFDAVTAYIPPNEFANVDLAKARQQLNWLARFQTAGTTENPPYYHPTQTDSS